MGGGGGRERGPRVVLALGSPSKDYTWGKDPGSSETRGTVYVGSGVDPRGLREPCHVVGGGSPGRSTPTERRVERSTGLRRPRRTETTRSEVGRGPALQVFRSFDDKDGILDWGCKTSTAHGWCPTSIIPPNPLGKRGGPSPGTPGSKGGLLRTTDPIPPRRDSSLRRPSTQTDVEFGRSQRNECQ